METWRDNFSQACSWKKDDLSGQRSLKLCTLITSMVTGSYQFRWCWPSFSFQGHRRVEIKIKVRLSLLLKSLIPVDNFMLVFYFYKAADIRTFKTELFFFKKNPIFSHLYNTEPCWLLLWQCCLVQIHAFLIACGALGSGSEVQSLYVSEHTHYIHSSCCEPWKVLNSMQLTFVSIALLVMNYHFMLVRLTVTLSHIVLDT